MSNRLRTNELLRVFIGARMNSSARQDSRATLSLCIPPVYFLSPQLVWRNQSSSRETLTLSPPSTKKQQQKEEKEEEGEQDEVFVKASLFVALLHCKSNTGSISSQPQQLICYHNKKGKDWIYLIFNPEVRRRMQSTRAFERVPSSDHHGRLVSSPASLQTSFMKFYAMVVKMVGMGLMESIVRRGMRYMKIERVSYTIRDSDFIIPSHINRFHESDR